MTLQDCDLKGKLDGVLDEACLPILDTQTETNSKVIDYVLDNSKRSTSGRLIMPLSWNNKNFHLLSQNYKLAMSVLNSNHKKLSKTPNLLKMYDDVIQEQLKTGVIDKIVDVQKFLLENPQCSFLAHNGIFKLSKETSKCRIVFLSNLAEKNKVPSVSHNQALLPGPNLNHKITTAITLLRFDKYLLVFDICKAFLQIQLNEFDSNRLLFLWYNNLCKGDMKVVIYRNLRLSFGLRPSPMILMLALYYILILNPSNDENVCKIGKDVYNTIYMDNGGYTANTEKEIFDAFIMLPKIFGDYKFDLQQFFTNSKIANLSETGSTSTDNVKFFGMQWHVGRDELSPNKIALSLEANTKRKILSSLNAIYDVYNLYAPILLRARLFMQSLQVDPKLTWDTILDPDRIREWKNISKQVNATPVISIARSMGPRNGKYSLNAFTDASAQAYGTVFYLKDMDSNQVSFLCARNKLVSKNSSKRMPPLELQGVSFGAELLLENYDAMCGDTVVTPVHIVDLNLYTDSMVCIQWIERYAILFEKMQKVSVFVKNRLRAIEMLTHTKPISFFHVAGAENPADFLTRPCGYKVLMKSCFFTGPTFLTSTEESAPICAVTLPNPNSRNVDEVPGEVIDNVTSTMVVSTKIEASEGNGAGCEHLIPLDRFSNFKYYLNVVTNVFRFVNKLKLKMNLNQSKSGYEVSSPLELKKYSLNFIVRTEQRNWYPEVFKYLDGAKKFGKNLPDLFTKFNLYKDCYDVLRIKSKLPQQVAVNPILLAKCSKL